MSFGGGRTDDRRVKTKMMNMSIYMYDGYNNETVKLAIRNTTKDSVGNYSKESAGCLGWRVLIVRYGGC
jgi:hypothetical protein